MKTFIQSMLCGMMLGVALLLSGGCGTNWSQMPWQHDYQRPTYPFMHQTNSIPNPDWKAP